MHGVEVSPGYREGDDVRADILLATRMPHEATELHWLGRGQATRGVLLIFKTAHKVFEMPQRIFRSR